MVVIERKRAEEKKIVRTHVGGECWWGVLVGSVGGEC
jgi:hypothetical protein